MSQRLLDPTTAVDAAEREHRASARFEWQRLALFIGGVAFAVGNLLHPLEHNDAAYHSATWKAAHLLIFFSLPLLVLGLPALHRALVRRVGSTASTIAVAGSVVGLIGIAPGAVIEAFVAPMVGHQAMQGLESGGMGMVNATLGSAYLGGTIVLGWAVTRARLRCRWAGPSIVASALVLLGVMSATGPVAGAVIIGATAAYGISLSALAATLPAREDRLTT